MNWQSELSQTIREPLELLRLLELEPDLFPATQEAGREFPVHVPRGFAARMAKGDPHDPLLLQVLPLAQELEPIAGCNKDPVGDLTAMQAPGVLHKYRDRVLLITTGACAIHCRYCVRRHFPYARANAAAQQWLAALEYIRHHPAVTEVVLSGGDPLVNDDDRLRLLIDPLTRIPHLKRLRIHTRIPIVLPQRIDDSLLNVIGNIPLKTLVVVQVNHANEINGPVRQALARLKQADIVLLNQSVLLKGVNDNSHRLAELSETLFDAGVMPYYIHMLDEVAGAGHFTVKAAAARRIFHELRQHLPGYLVPRLVREQAGDPYKKPVGGHA